MLNHMQVLLHFVLVLNVIGNIFATCCENSCDEEANVVKDLMAQRNVFNSFDEIRKKMCNLYSRPETKPKDLPIFDIRFDAFPERCQDQATPSNCGEATACTQRSGYYHLKINQYSNDTFLVECDAHHEGGDWTVIQRRQDGSVDFYRTWSEYKLGFGDIDGEFFIGLDKLHALTNYDGPQELLILMENSTNFVEGYAKYDSFMIGDETEKYILKRTGRYTGTAGESLRAHVGSKFTTKDQDNDMHSSVNCAVAYMGAWWYYKCHSSNLNGHYGDAAHGKGVNWNSFSTLYNSLKFVKMMVRRRRN